MKLKFDSALVIVMLNVTYAYESFLVWYDILYQYAYLAAGRREPSMAAAGGHRPPPAVAAAARR